MSTEALSRVQRGLWFLDRLRPGSSAYNLATAARVRGGLTTVEIRAFFQVMVDRHAVLRSTFRREGEEPVRIVHERVEAAFQKVDAETWTDTELQAAMEEAAWRPFDLERGPVFRVTLFQRGPERALVVAMHHIVADFGSIGLFQEPAGDAGEGAKEYADFVAWQEALLAGPEGERLWNWWRERLEGLPDLDLPADRRSRWGDRTDQSDRTDRSDQLEMTAERGGVRRREIGPETLARLKSLARSRRATLYVTLLAGFEALLYRYTGQEDFAVGSPASGRPRGFGRTFGYFTNPLVMRADLAGEPSFRELVDRTRRTVAEALEHQHFPLSLLVERLRPGSELFQAMLVMHQGPEGLVSLVLGEEGGRLPLPGFGLESLPLAPRAAQLDVTLAAGERRGTLGLALVYDAARFEAPTAARWLEHLAQLLAGAVEHPDVPVSELPLLSPWERQQVLVEANDGSDDAVEWSTLHEGFERQAEATPEAVAVIDDERRQLTYRELDARASELAERLRRMGVGPETIVGVRLPRKAELIVSLLGVLKAGAAYLPLDPSYPEERIGFMVADAGATVIIEPSPPAPLPRAGEGSTAKAENLEAGPGSLAYLIYTSGSTGRPKGVAIEHAAAVRLVAWAGKAFSPAELRGVLAATSVSFDLSIFEIFVPLSFGGTVILAENALALPSHPTRDEVTLINTVPSALAGLLELGPLPLSVRTVNLAGEPLRRSLADRILALGVRLWDLYGPSEDTTYSTGAIVRIGDPWEPPIGWPVAGSRSYVVDRRLRPLPLGIPGELCLGGGGLARGYLGRPELTAERFVPDPFDDRSGARLYRTGDLVRRRGDGALEYLGRIDHQVKVRGFRIEPGEVEAVLLACGWVREAVVVARDGALTAYVSLMDECPAGPEEVLRDVLRARLPAPFVPSSFTVLHALPRTPNGKVDREALPAPVQTGASGGGAPAGIVEETLAAIWADLLGRTAIGRADRFFDLGGHSLLAARALARVREAWGAEISLGAFFAEPTLAGLARRIETVQGTTAIPIPRAPRDLPLPLSFAQQRFWFLDRLEPGRAIYNVPVALRFGGPLDPAFLAGALREIARRHEALRTTFEAGEEEPVQQIEPPPIGFLLPCVDLADLPPEHAAAEERRLERAEARRPFDLERGPLFRALLVRRSRTEHRLVLVLHHIACDGWSLGILFSELSSLAVGAPAPEPRLQYADFAAWQRSEPIPDRRLAAWCERLAGVPVLELPADRPEPGSFSRLGRSARGTTLVRLLPADLVAALAGAARSRGATLFMGLLAGFDALLHRHTGQTDLVVGTVVAGRGRVELERVVGCFVNTLALRVDLGKSSTFADLLAEVRSVTLAAFRDQEVPLERLIEEVQLDRGGRRPFPRALVVLQNEPLAPPVLPGLTVEVEPVDTGGARSDLTLSFHEVADGLLTTIELARDVFDESTVARLWERFQLLLAVVAADPLVPLSELPLFTGAERWEISTARSPADPGTPDPRVEREAPQGALEETIAAIFADVLGRERVGRRTSFFDLGGHSLLAVRVVSRVRRALGVEVPLGVLFDAPTVAGLAAAVEASRGLRPALPPLVRSPEAGDAPLSFAQQRLWFLDRLESGAATYNLPVAVRLRGELDIPALAGALERIVRRHEALRTTFHEGESGPVQRVEPEGMLALRVEDLSSLGEQAEATAFWRMAEEAVRPFDLAKGPVFRTLLLRIAAGDHLLVASLHHIVSDGWSMGVLVRELSLLYRGTPLQELPVQYADWVRWQRRWLAGEVLEAGVGWWREALRGLPERLDLPTDRPRRSSERRRGARWPVRLGAELTRDLGVLARREGATLFMVVLAGFQALLGRRAGQDDLAVGSPVAGRTRVEIEELIGFFASTLVLRADLRGDPSGRELLRRTRATVLAAHEHQHVPFERLVEDLAPERTLGRTPLFEAMLAFQNAAPEPPDLPGLAADLIPAETGTAKLDLLLDLGERDGELSGSLEYDADLFEAVTIDRLLAQLTVLLRGLAEEPDARIADILLLAGVEHRQVMGESTAMPAPIMMFEPPQGPIEEGLAAIWSEVLGQERVGRWDRFFDRGGHSLLAAQVVSRVRRAFGVEIPLRAFFEEPALEGIARRIAAAAGEGSPAPLAGAAREGPAPLSFAQRRLWFLAQLDPVSPVYNLPAAVRLRGSLDIAALERALAGVVLRHESLRTRFLLMGNEPVQVVEDAPVPRLPCVDLRALGPWAEAEARRLAAWEGARPFDLQRGPVFRSLLVRLANREHQLVVTMHHIVSDGWSLGVFVRELAALHAALPLPELPVRYRDFAVWQRDRLSGVALEESVAFWRGELRGLPPGIDLPVDRPRPPVQTFRGAVRPFSLDTATTGRLRELTRAEGATLFMVLLAGFQALLARWSGQEDLAVGTPVAGRTRVELEGLIGLFVNTLVLRGDLAGDPDVRTLVRRARERFLAAQAHQDLPFEKLVEELRPERNPARPPLFQVHFVLQNAPRPLLALPGLEVRVEPVETGTARTEIQLTLEEVDGGLAGSLDSNRDLFDASTMDRLLGHYAALLAAAVASPEGKAFELGILTAGERQQLLWEWNPSARFPRERPVHEMFAGQAALRPQATAVVCGEERITYGDLDRQANALARRLRRLGIGPEERVAICLERSVGMIVCILGILKAGGTYVPLDPEHPAQRQALVLADSEARVFITHSDLVERLAPPADLPLVLWDREKDAIAREEGSPLGDAGVSGSNAEYIIYTSGSTGHPKGVVVTHSGVARLLAATDHWFHFGPDDVWALFSSLAFDFSVWEIWGALALGGRLVIVPYWMSRTPSAFYDLIASERVTVLNQTPSAFRQIVQAEADLPAPRPLALRWVIFGGEALDPAILGPWFDRHGDQMPRMINMYGITETTVHVTWRQITAADVPRAPVSPVGRPIPDLQVYILDARHLLSPVGVPGEICVGGDGLARGYFRRPDLTAERFIPDPFAGRPGARLYRSGDLARFLPDGDIEYLGRIDFQVKIRGFRIELGEIEAVLKAFPAVHDAVVLAREDRSGDRRLVAWVVPRQPRQPRQEIQGDLRVDELRAFLRGRLPGSMVPSAFVVLETLPLTENGKLDRWALPEPEAQSGVSAVLPRTATEEVIAAAWREALGLAVVGVEDSFFDLGGHSLLVVEVHRRLVSELPELAIVDLFRYPTISALAGYLSREKVDQIQLQETRERAEDRTGRARRQRELRRQTRRR